MNPFSPGEKEKVVSQAGDDLNMRMTDKSLEKKSC